jgi:hypothetical protein
VRRSGWTLLIRDQGSVPCASHEQGTHVRNPAAGVGYLLQFPQALQLSPEDMRSMMVKL